MRLKVEGAGVPAVGRNDFNSKLVRLKVKIKINHFCVFKKFQFQTGAIKRVKTLTVQVVYSVFQFQTGAIKSHINRPRIKTTASFQFQTGAIKRTHQTL